MTFINPAALFALIAAAVPLLIHLFSRQRRKDVDFSTLKFLKRLEKKRLRRLKIAEILLLILRTIAIILIVLAFARPALKSGGGMAGKSAAEAVFIIDNSLPSQALTPRGSLIAQERRTALELTGIFNDDDKINLINSVNTNRILSSEINDENRRDKLRNWIYDIEGTDAAPEWESSIRNSINLLAGSELPNREIFIFSPFYRFFDNLQALSDSASKHDIRLYFLQTGPPKINNLALTEFKFESGIIQKNLPVTVAATISNFGEDSYENIPLSLFVEDERVASADFSLLPYQQTIITLKFVPDKSGFYRAAVRMEIDDPLAADNLRQLVFYVPEKISVCLIGDDREIRNSELALNSGKKTTSIETEIPTENDIALALNPSKVVFLMGAEQLSSQKLRFIKNHVENGGGLLVAPSDKMDIAILNKELLKSLGCPQYSTVIEAKASWGNVDLQHPLFEGIFGESPAVESPEFRRYAEIVGNTGNNIIEFRNGDPFLTEFRCDKGIVLLFTAGFSDYWSDMVHRGIFTPMLHRAATYLGGHVLNGKTSITAGLPLIYLTKPDFSDFSIIIPGDETRKIIPAAEANNTYLEFTETYDAGIYCFKGDTDTLSIFAVNPAVEYSELNRNPIDKYRAIIQLDASASDLYDSILEVRIGKELWKILLTIGLTLLVIELLIVRLLK